MTDDKFMNIALAAAKRNLGQTRSNPSVGCVIEKNGEILAITTTAPSGRPHAENLALQMVGDASKGANVYVTLEPCAHEGKTPACARLLKEAEVNKVVISTLDPDPRTAGKGVEILQSAGVEVEVGVGEATAREQNAGFFKAIEQELPYVMLKAATTADNKFFKGKDGQTSWITNPLSRKYVQVLRAKYDALITSTSTIIDDNPKLNVRLSGMENLSPQVVVLGETALPSEYSEALTFTGELKEILKQLTEKKFNRVMIEAGPTLANAFLKAGLVDEICWFKSSQNGKANDPDYFDLELLKNFRPTKKRNFGDDNLTYLNPI